MKNRMGLCLFCLFALPTLFFLGKVGAAEPGALEKRWSFTFNNCTVSQALSEIAKTTNREIVVEGETITKVDRKYTNQTLEDIVRDLLGNEDYVLEISPGETGPHAMKIRLKGAKNLKRDSSSPPSPPKRAGIQSPPMPPGLPPGPSR